MNWPFWLAVLVMLMGILGTFFPVLPGLPLIFGAALAYSWFNGFQEPNGLQLLALLILAILGSLIDYFSGLVGAKKYGASKYGTTGAFIGGVLGFFFMPWGLIIGPLAGAWVGELFAGKKNKEATRVAWGTLVGILGGGLVKVILGAIMLGLFIYYVT